ncbi:MAG: aminomethyl-transferring glycine dehydrogenase subunit GcvPA [Clostridia bacterium]|nr:aminomethyl-transferring glycine dehydrogenase subunit GcvPA [Clostridia bacterium]
MGRYIPSTRDELRAMLAEIGMNSVDELYAVVPEGLLCDNLNLPGGLSELELDGKIRDISDKNTVFKSVFRGAGAYDHYIPSIVKRVVSKETFVTSYTPYQPEISQGVLQSIFEYQSMICELMGMDASNASVYDGATAACEGIRMCLDKKRPLALVAMSANPMTIETIETYADACDMEIDMVGVKDGRLDIDELKGKLSNRAGCLFLQSPNFMGLFEDVEAIKDELSRYSVKLVLAVNPIASALYKTSGELGADVCVAEGQPLGMPMSFGGPYLGIMAANKAMMRKLPGRIVGRTRDDRGNAAYVLTLQAREQHIRREKASSNVCSNQALCAMTAAVYMSAMGPDGLRECARQCHSKAVYLMNELSRIGFSPVYEGEFFNEFASTCPVDKGALLESLAEKGILGGLPVKEGILWCATEKNAISQIDALISAVKEALA